MLVKKRRIASVAKIKKAKSPRQIERHIKGVANHRRIEILFLISENKGIDVESISRNLRCNFKTTSVHLSRLAQAGLVRKNYRGRTVTHELSPYGWTFCKFLKTFQHS
ncbi:MAG TPA: helix-turn-helix transcriptional regulator [Candidatus Moranbacteria bacterium]|jgi:predicted transcriptional regulator|nr:helix-turn-helix transcriptional regulator [Candidatus Moranbacteria bacterium]HOF42394.1 helix-turn-helix transcriptional regulator [Candidatus Moranbacteria bacterium]HPX94251.1 helix-turn-helix transcriptional regulator [Candidatus Moranbacteria bacterium]HQB59660.1 helix-turn-helix transcriptional regulator [Candidatus Moranbacteria bacterium]